MKKTKKLPSFEFRRTYERSSIHSSWHRADDGPVMDYDDEFCGCGPNVWFVIPARVMVIDVIVSDSPKDGYLLIYEYHSWGIEDPLEERHTGFYGGPERWFTHIYYRYGFPLYIRVEY